MQGVSKKSKKYGANNLNVHFEHSASAVFRRPGEGWTLSTVKKVCSRVDLTGSAILRKLGSGTGRPATASACAVCRCKTIIVPLVGYTKL